MSFQAAIDRVAADLSACRQVTDIRRTQDTKKSASSVVGRPIEARNARTGKRSPNDVMKSQRAWSTSASTVSRASRSISGSILATAAGANHRFISWRYFMCSGGSMNDGRNRYSGSGSVATIEWLQNVAGILERLADVLEAGEHPVARAVRVPVVAVLLAQLVDLRPVGAGRGDVGAEVDVDRRGSVTVPSAG